MTFVRSFVRDVAVPDGGGGGGNGLVVSGATISAYEFDAEYLNQDSGGAGAAVTNGDPIGYASEVGGNGYWLTVNNSFSKPTYDDTTFPSGACSHPATGDYLFHNITGHIGTPANGDFDNFGFDTDWSMSFGWQMPPQMADTAPMVIMGSTTGIGSIYPRVVTDGRFAIQLTWNTPSNSGAFNPIFPAGSIVAGGAYVGTMTYNSTTREMKLYLDGVEGGSSYTVPAGISISAIQYFGTGSPSFNANIVDTGGFVSGFGIYSKVLSDEERASVEGRLAERLGITL